MNTLAIFTTTRAEFGLLSPLIKKLEKESGLNYKLFVGGAHLTSTQGQTIEEIKEEGFTITETFDYLSVDNTIFGLSNSLATETTQISSIFEKHDFDFACVPGDRYELLPIVQTAILYRKPIIHIHGGEATQGAIDEQIRHMITKAAHIHFASCKEYYQNIRKMGEQDWRVFNTGALTVENIQELANITKTELFKDLGLNTSEKTILMTYHPVTLETQISAKEQIQNVFDAIEAYDLQVVITAPNMDSENNIILDEINKRKENNKYRFVPSLGAKKYLSLLRYVEFVIGNSSSGILEVPYFKVPTINIGKRQDGRIRHRSIIDCDYDKASVSQSIDKSLSTNFRESLRDMDYKFGDGTASKKMIEAIKSVKDRKDLMIKKLDFPC